jgi:phage-related minor tail protein
VATIGKLVVEIGANIENLKKGLKKSQGLVAGAAKKLGGLGKSIGGGLSAVAGPAAAGLLAVSTAAATVGAVALDAANDIDVATAEIAAGLGISKEAASEYEDEMKGIFANNFGEDFSDIGETIVTVNRAIEDLDDKGLQQISEGALAIRDTFDKDIAETVDATDVLMKQFGLTGVQATDFITKGLQDIPADDLLDTIREYGNQFSGAGFDADQFFSILKTGAAGGVLGTDKIGDAIKEMSLLLNEAGDDTVEAFGTIGLDFDAIQSEVAAGNATWADYFDNIVGGLQSIEDPIAKSQAAVAIFGTQAEDLGPAFVDSLDAAAVKMEDMAGATGSLNERYNNLGSALEGLKRRAIVALAPLGKGLLEAINASMPKVIEFFDSVLGPAIEKFGAGAGPILSNFAAVFTDTIGPAMALISDALKRINIALGGTGEGVDTVSFALSALESLLGVVISGIQFAALAMQGLAAGVEFVSGAISTVLGWIDALGDKLAKLEIPDWLKPGSPPPLANALGDIKKGLQSLPSLEDAFTAGGGSPAALAGVGGGGQSSTITINAGGISATSTTTGDPVEQALRMFAEMVKQNLKRDES